MTECEFLFAALAEKHNTVIRKIREIPPWEWGGEFLELEPTNRGINRHKTAQSYNGQRGQSPCGHFPSASREYLSMGGES